MILIYCSRSFFEPMHSCWKWRLSVACRTSSESGEVGVSTWVCVRGQQLRKIYWRTVPLAWVVFSYLVENYSRTWVFLFFFISWRLITLQYCSGFCHTLTWISHGFTCIPHPDPPSHLPLHPIPLGLPSTPGPSTCLMHPAWAGDLFHPR